jgi:hypothetical protein
MSPRCLLAIQMQGNAKRAVCHSIMPLSLRVVDKSKHVVVVVVVVVVVIVVIVQPTRLQYMY